MTYRLVIDGRLPGLNEYIDACRRAPQIGNRMKQTEQERVEWAIRQQMRGVRISRPVRLTYRFVEPNQKRDQDNVSSFARKVIQDALVKTGVLYNDGWKQVAGSEESFDVDKDHPRIIVLIEEEE